MNIFIAIFSAVNFGLIFAKKFVFDYTKHDVVEIKENTFDTIITKYRTWQIAALLFINPSDKATQAEFDKYSELATELKGMFKFGLVDCEKAKKFCTEHNVSKFPSVMIYPRMPMPAFIFEGATKDALRSSLLRLLPSEHIKILTAQNSEAFIADDPHVPKVLLFSKKNSPPALFKALGNEFRNEMNFGFVNTEKDETNNLLVKKYKVKKFPSIILIEDVKKTPQHYTGDISFSELKKWINLFRETYVRGVGVDQQQPGGAQQSSKVSKPWLRDSVPEMTEDSSDDVCIKPDGICVIYLSDGPINAEAKSGMESLKTKYAMSSSEARGITMKFMWMDLTIEESFRELFHPREMPFAVALNPHKRMRFTSLVEGHNASIDGIGDMLERIYAGDSRFAIVKGGKLPAYAKRSKATPKREEL